MPKTPRKEADAMPDKNYAYFTARLAELIERYEGRRVVIKDERVIGVYDSFEGAY